MKKILCFVVPLTVVVLSLIVYRSGVIERISRAREEKRRLETTQAQKRVISFYASLEDLIKLQINPYFSDKLQKRANELLKSGGSVRRMVVCSDDEPGSYEIKEISGPTRFSISARYESDREQVLFVRVIKSDGEWLIDEVDCLVE